MLIWLKNRRKVRYRTFQLSAEPPTVRGGAGRAGAPVRRSAPQVLCREVRRVWSAASVHLLPKFPPSETLRVQRSPPGPPSKHIQTTTIANRSSPLSFCFVGIHSDCSISHRALLVPDLQHISRSVRRLVLTLKCLGEIIVVVDHSMLKFCSTCRDVRFALRAIRSRCGDQVAGSSWSGAPGAREEVGAKRGGDAACAMATARCDRGPAAA